LYLKYNNKLLSEVINYADSTQEGVNYAENLHFIAPFYRSTWQVAIVGAKNKIKLESSNLNSEIGSEKHNFNEQAIGFIT
jgi:hypothetical protein